MGDIEVGTDVLVIGAGPAGYTAAIRLGQAGLDVTLAGPEVGGTCLHHGCIPVKVFTRALDLAVEITEAEELGIRADHVSVDLGKLRSWDDQVINRLEAGIRSMLKASGVQVFEGTCTFTSSTTAAVHGHGGTQQVRFNRAIIATGKHYIVPKGIAPDGKRIVFPYAIGQLEKVPATAVVLGGGVAGTIVSTLLARAGSKVALAHKSDALLKVVDDDVLQPALKGMAEAGIQIFPRASWEMAPDKKSVTIRSGDRSQDFNPDLIVLCPPSRPSIETLSLDKTKVKLDERGFVAVDENYCTADPSIYAIGDVLDGQRNACVAFRDGLSVARVLSGKPGLPAPQAVPLTIDAGLDIACAGMTEKAARSAGLDVTVSRSPYSANGGAATLGFRDGLIKVVAEKATGRILGVQMVGHDAGNLIGEAMLAIETGARLEDVALTLHPHPEMTEIFFDACARGAGLSANTMKK